jgi:hypothetical protein
LCVEIFPEKDNLKWKGVTMSTATAMSIENIERTTLSESRLLRVRELWERSRESQLEIGRLLYEERAERLAVGGRGVEGGFQSWLRDAGIPKKSAYRRIAEYEVSIGLRAEDSPDDKPVSVDTPFETIVEKAINGLSKESLYRMRATIDHRLKPKSVPSGTTFQPVNNADVVQGEHATASREVTRGEMAYRIDPSAPILNKPRIAAATQSPQTPSLEVLAQCIRRFGDCTIRRSGEVHHLEMKLIGLTPERLVVALEAFNTALGSCDDGIGDGGAL